MRANFLLFVVIVICMANAPTGVAQQKFDAWSDGATENRLKSIYESAEYSPRRFSPEWWSNSEGYSVDERDAQSRKVVKAHYRAQTGARVDSPPVRKVSRARSRISPDGSHQIEYIEGNLFVKNRATEQQIQLTNRQSGRDIGFREPRWSLDGKLISFIESDQTDVRKRSMLIPSDPSYPGVREQRFARVGEDIGSLRVGIVDRSGQNLQWLPIETPEEGYYLGMVEWAGSTNELLIERLSRARDKREFFLASTDGKMKRVFVESDPAWVVASQARNSGLEWIRDGKEFIVISEKDGWRHAYLYNREGKEIALLTPGEYDIIERSTVDESGGWYYFYASPKNGTERYLYRVPLDGTGTLERMTPKDQPGTHTYKFSPNQKYAFHTYSSFDKPPIVELVDISNHRTIKTLEKHSQLHKRAASVISRPTDFIQLDIGNDITMDAWMIKPRQFDEAKKYPVFIYVYGEPHAQTVLNEWGAGQSHFLRVVADLGYLVVSIDNRGTPAPKGAAWRRSVFGSLGPISTEDQVKGLRELGRSRSYVDLSRVGIWGWSGGGSNTLNALFRNPKDYHVGIAVVPKPQPHLYNAWFQEIYMGTRESNRAGYQQSAPINFAEGLQGKLLIVTGSGETNTHIQIIEGLIDRLILLGKKFDYMVYPNRNHGLREGAGTLVHVRMLIIRYLLENLTPGPR
ncbi:S9 family peptidase [Mariniblastus sp.]|nr:S9 family peptidase [Mariniblastus sp.]